MIMHTRRQFLAATASAAALGGLSAMPALSRAVAATPTRLAVERRAIEVLGRAASVFGIRQPDGTPGLTLQPGDPFSVMLENRAGEDTIIHWHGQTPPWMQDGVADRFRPVLAAGESRAYDFAARPGTHWMHSHHGLQEQLLMAAPLVVRSEEDRRADVQEVTVLLHDFTFRDPAEVLAALTGGAMAHGSHGTMSHGTMNHGAMGHGSGNATMDQGSVHAGHAMPMATPMSGGVPMDLNDVEYDAYLANDRTLDDPEVVRVERGGRVRLRLINGATSTAFHIDLGALDGTVVAVDGTPVRPVAGRVFPMAMGQRLDILLALPGEGAWPILARREGDRQRTGLILATAGAAVAKVPGLAEQVAGPIDLSLERRLTAVTPPDPRSADRVLRVELTGGMAPYVWSMDGKVWGEASPIRVVRGERVRIEMVNRSPMAHPMHLHGHHFQVVALDGVPLAGAVRDTVLVPLNGSVTIAFDADNPGRWPFHCHNLLHMATGMMTEVVYDGIA
ncbi:multicopper oxidase domain-containing protein [Azospirillum sp. RWY-5-1]|uniref:Multicopper oxidase domain-containing protein n=1 Tax=Azospirillum oleiclasticum TaxID=2735135 RepID=A0ABX2TMR8_9PROT|nr:multicopper oxidase domain-containing protein [Azospirillum oleiclasticum]NYZ17391.1 multicopper oxidase domain-containing protein [Azospirillum oleiclasticum]NYZ24768.1 multicopper oxidase domain-containing protein [Azospirillum oleiclasticum]